MAEKDIDWGKIKRAYMKGGTTFRKLAEKYGISESTVKHHAAAEKWTELRHKARTKSDQKLINAVSTENARIGEGLIEAADKLLDKLNEIVENHEIDAKGLKNLASALKDLRDVKGYQSDLDILQQKKQIEKLDLELERLRMQLETGDSGIPGELGAAGGGVVLIPAVMQPTAPPEE